MAVSSVGVVRISRCVSIAAAGGIQGGARVLHGGVRAGRRRVRGTVGGVLVITSSHSGVVPNGSVRRTVGGAIVLTGGVVVR